MAFISPISTDASGQPRQTGSLQSLDKDDFLQLLVTKLQYQDPMNPMQDEDFVAQLAQFSSLEQMHNISEGIAQSNEWDFLQMQSINNSLASSLIGKEIKAEYSGVYVESGSEPTVSFTLDQAAANIDFTVKDSQGNVIARFSKTNLAAGVNSVKWDGKDTLGNRVADGYYAIDAKATTTTGTEFKPNMSVVGTVSTIQYRDGGAFVNIGGLEIPLGDIRAVGEPGSFIKK